MPAAADVRRLFSGVAPRYDLLNRLLSFGIDRNWRRDVAAGLALNPQARVLDLCCGTGDLALEMAGRANAFGCDFTWEMLVRARAKSERLGRTLRLIAADALRLPFPDGAFDAATVAFGVRNLEDLTGGLGEFRRVLRPGGRLAILEFSHPTHLLLRLPYWIYLNGFLPWFGRLVSRRKGAYFYLATSIAGFPEPEEVSGILERQGFAEVRFRRLTGGIVAVHEATA